MSDRAGGGWSVRARARTPGDLRALGEALAPLLLPGDVLLVSGGLGAGKTTLAQGVARGLDVTGPVTSPTFTLVRQYPCRGSVRQFLHADVYRLDSLAEVSDLGLAELVEEGGAALVEWGDAAEPVLGRGALRIAIEPDAESEERAVTLADPDGTWSDRRLRLLDALGPFDAVPAGAAPAGPDGPGDGDGSGDGGGEAGR